MKPLDLADHAEVRRRYRIAKRYWGRRGVRPNERGETTISWEMEREALEAYEREHPGEDTPEPQPKSPAIRGEVELVNPGEGRLTAAILCPGPSLSQTWPKGGRLPGYDLVIAVNNAAEHAPCEWWSAQDHGPLKTYEGRPSVGICTSGSNAEALTTDRAWKPKGMTDADVDSLVLLASHRLVHEDAPRRGGWSTVNAIILAARLGAKVIDLYGDDKTGNRYYDGIVNRGTKAGRWERETRNQKDLTDALERVGVSVANIRPATIEQTEAEG